MVIFPVLRQFSDYPSGSTVSISDLLTEALMTTESNETYTEAADEFNSVIKFTGYPSESVVSCSDMLTKALLTTESNERYTKMAHEYSPVIEEQNTYWFDILREITTELGWSYAALWTKNNSKLVWKEGFFNIQNRGDLAQLFHFDYASCVFESGVGFPGLALDYKVNGILWLNGAGLESLPRPLLTQMWFLRTAGIQTILCLPFGNCVLELGNENLVPESNERAANIKEVLTFLLTRRFQENEVQFSPAATVGETSIPAQAESRFGGQSTTTTMAMSSVMGPHSYPPSSLGMSENEMLGAGLRFSQSSFQGGEVAVVSRAPSQEFRSLYSEMIRPEDVVTFESRQVDRNMISGVTQLSVGNQIGVSQATPAASLASWGAGESSLSQLEINPMPSWSSIADAPAEFFSLQQQMPTYSTTISHLATVEKIQQQNQFGDGGQTMRSPSSSRSLEESQSVEATRIQTAEAKRISSGILESLADCRISELEAARSIGGNNNGGLGGPESSWMAGGPASKSTSPEVVVPHSWQGYGIHPRLSESTAQQQQLLRKQEASTTANTNSAQPDIDPTDASFMLVEFGNFLQLGTASGQVINPPQEHDEAAVSHMLAERRRRTRQNENFAQLKTIVPAASKMDKASLLAATIAYINKLHEQVADLEQTNHSLTQQLIGGQDQSSLIESQLTGSPSSAKRKSPVRKFRTSPKHSPPREDKFRVLAQGSRDPEIVDMED